MQTNNLFAVLFVSAFTFFFGMLMLPNAVSSISSPTVVAGEVAALQDCHYSSDSSSPTCRAEYVYTYNGMSYRAVTDFSSNIFDRGESINVIVDKDNPTSCAPLSMCLLSFGFLFVAFAVLMGSFIYLYQKTRPSKMIANNAQPALS